MNSLTPDSTTDPTQPNFQRYPYYSYLADMRREFNITQKELAERAHYSNQVILRAEQGLHPNLSPNIAKALSEIIVERGGPYVDPDRFISCYVEDRTHNINTFRAELHNAVRFQDVLDTAWNLIELDADLTRVLSPVARFRTLVFEYYGLPSSAIKFCQYTGLHTAQLETAENPKRLLPWASLAPVSKVFEELFLFDAERLDRFEKLHDHYYLLARASD